MKVLAIDPGFGRCGVAVVEKENGPSTGFGAGKEKVLYSDCIETSASLPFPERLSAVVAECARLMKSHAPHAVALERLYITKNQKTAMQVAEVRGALIGKAAELGLSISEYTPGEIKSAAAGWGAADKKQVIKMLHALVKIEKKIRHDDEYDAIAIGITHLARAR